MVKFDLDGAVGVALHAGDGSSLRAASTRRSNMVKVGADFDVSPAITSGELEVQEFYVLPYGVLVVPAGRVPVDESDPEALCGLLLVSRSSAVTCVDDGIDSVWRVRVLPDAFFYAGYDWSGGRNVIRRYSGVTLETVWSESPGSASSVHAFEAAEDWSVYVSGRTVGEFGTVGWVRRITPAGVVESVMTTSDTYRVRYLSRFPDGNIYFGNDRDGWAGMYRILTESHSVDPLPWLGYDSEEGYHHNAGEVGVYLGFPNQIPVLFDSPAGVIGIARRMDDISFNGLFVFYPEPRQLDTGIQALMLVERADDALILGGLDESGRYRLVLFDFAAPALDLLGDARMEVHSAAYLDGVVTFSGRRFSDNSDVVGTYTVATGELVFEEGSLGIEGFQPLDP